MKANKIILLLLIVFSDVLYSQDFTNVRIINPGRPLNTRAYEYGGNFINSDQYFIFTSNRIGAFIFEDFSGISHDVFLCKNLGIDTFFTTEIIGIDTKEKLFGLNTVFNEGAGFISYDNSEFYLTCCDRPHGSGDCDIFWFGLTISDRIIFSHLHKIDMINSKIYESQPSLSPDGKTMFFVKDVGERKVELDIWYSVWDNELGDWGEPKELSEANTSGTDTAPYIAPDNKTLFFSSNGLDESIGKCDLYYIKRDDNGDWSEPVNLGEPINSKYNDVMFSLNSKANIAVISSYRADIKNYQGRLDIFFAYADSFIDEYTIVSWKTIEKETEIHISIIDSEGNEVRSVAMGKYKPGRYSYTWDGNDNEGNRCKPGFYDSMVIFNMSEFKKSNTIKLK